MERLSSKSDKLNHCPAELLSEFFFWWVRIPSRAESLKLLPSLSYQNWRLNIDRGLKQTKVIDAEKARFGAQ